jgi:uncharacterized metal-binding protein
MSSPEVTAPVTFPARFAWLQREIRHRVRPYHVIIGALIGLITAVFGVIILLILIVATNFNPLGWVE